MMDESIEEEDGTPKYKTKKTVRAGWPVRLYRAV